MYQGKKMKINSWQTKTTHLCLVKHETTTHKYVSNHSQDSNSIHFKTKLNADDFFPSVFVVRMHVCRVCFNHFSEQQVSYFLPACSCLCCSWTPSTAWWKSNTAEEGERGHTLSHTSEKAGLMHSRTHTSLYAHTQAFTQIKSRQRPERTYLYVLCLRWSTFSPSPLGLNTQRYMISIFNL